jgi:hypothetical protein
MKIRKCTDCDKVIRLECKTGLCRQCYNKRPKVKNIALSKERRRQAQAKYFRANKEKMNIDSAKNYALNKDKINQQKREKNKDANCKAQKLLRNYNYRQRHKDSINFKLRERYHNDVSHRIKRQLRNRLNKIVKYNRKFGSAVKDLGCSINFLKTYLTEQFTDGMSWDNWGQGVDKWQIDHIRPLSQFNLEDRDELLVACHYTNLRPLWHSEHVKKSAEELRQYHQSKLPQTP